MTSWCHDMELTDGSRTKIGNSHRNRKQNQASSLRTRNRIWWQDMDHGQLNSPSYRFLDGVAHDGLTMPCRARPRRQPSASLTGAAAQTDCGRPVLRLRRVAGTRHQFLLGEGKDTCQQSSKLSVRCGGCGRQLRLGACAAWTAQRMRMREALND